MTQEEFELKIKEIGLEIIETPDPEPLDKTNRRFRLKETATGRMCKARWSTGIISDMMAFHGVDGSNEIRNAVYAEAYLEHLVINKKVPYEFARLWMDRQLGITLPDGMTNEEFDQKMKFFMERV